MADTLNSSKVVLAILKGNFLTNFQLVFLFKTPYQSGLSQEGSSRMVACEASQTIVSEESWFMSSNRVERKGSRPIPNQTICYPVIIGVQFSHSVVSDSSRPHESQHARPPCPWPTPGVYPNPCPSSWWCHPTISSSVVPFSSCLQSFPASKSFQWVSSLHQVAKVLEFQLKHQSFQLIFRTISFRMDWLDLLAVPGIVKSLLQHHSSKSPILWCQAVYILQLSHPYMTTGKTIALTRWTFEASNVCFLICCLSWS